MCITLDDVKHARQTIRTRIKKTPLIKAPDELSKKLKHSGQIYFKCENFQWTNTFKVRGAFNAILHLSDQEKMRGVVTRSSGNFAQAVAFAAQKLGIRAKIVLPDNIPKIKLQLTQQFGPEIVFAGPHHEEGDAVVKDIVEKEGMTLLHPYNQKNVIAGQGTAALEIFEDLPSIGNFFCPIGGGGLLSGCSTAFKALNQSIQITGVEPAGAADYYRSRQAGQPIELKHIDTIADGLRASVVGDLDWPLLQKNVDRAEIVSDQEIKQAMKYFKETMDWVTEPSGATAFASLLLHGQKLNDGDIVVMISGANVDPHLFIQWLEEA
jgi:threonine dehydratase